MNSVGNLTGLANQNQASVSPVDDLMCVASSGCCAYSDLRPFLLHIQSRTSGLYVATLGIKLDPSWPESHSLFEKLELQHKDLGPFLNRTGLGSISGSRRARKTIDPATPYAVQSSKKNTREAVYFLCISNGIEC